MRKLIGTVGAVVIVVFLATWFRPANSVTSYAAVAQPDTQNKPQPTAGCVPSGQKPRKCPTFTSTPTKTPLRPTNTATDTPTDTPLLPTDTPTDSPTNTPVPPTNTATDTPT